MPQSGGDFEGLSLSPLGVKGLLEYDLMVLAHSCRVHLVSVHWVSRDYWNFDSNVHRLDQDVSVHWVSRDYWNRLYMQIIKVSVHCLSPLGVKGLLEYRGVSP